MGRLQTPPCIQCKQTSIVILTDEEHSALFRNMSIQEALPDRDADFRELVKTGTHPACWDAMFPDEEES